LTTCDHKDNETEALMANVIKQFDRIVQLSPGLPQEMGSMAGSIKEPGTLADMIASTINSTPEEKQKVLEIQDSSKRLKAVTKLVHHQLEHPGIGQQDPVPGQGRHGQAPAGVLPAPAAQSHQGGAGGNR
jgi:ATP-dependent Lon protease